MRKAIFLLAIALLSIGTFAQGTTQGTLYAVTKKGKELGACPLKNTTVRTDISGFLARVNVKQEFENSYSEPIEAVYTFPLSQNGAVDDMTMTIGSRVVRGKIMKREEARRVYETAKATGQAASLLDQERPNIFTQAVANIMPGEKVVIEISYVETVKYEDGAYEFVFPMTVGPRYIPGSVTDASKIKPPVTDATRTGHDISIEVNLNAGVPVEAVRSDSHRIEQLNFSPAKSKVTLQGEKTIPNKDFILRYDVTGKKLQDGVLAHRDKRGGFFTLVLQPPDTVAPEDRTPKEIVFVLDTSGSMHGFPIEKAKEAMKLSLEGLYPEDTFNLITFAGDTHVLFEEPVPATQANLERAQAFLDTRQGGGGTEMMKAIKAALDPSDSQEHLRIVCFMTDAFVGNDNEIIAEIQKHPMARVFSFGIGSSVNRSLLDKMAEAGNGEVEYVGLSDDGSKAAKRFYERVRTPMLTDLSIDWNGMPVTDVYPGKIGDLFSAKPVVVNGRYTRGGSGTIKLKGKVAGQPYERTINLNLPDAESANDVLATLWARRRVYELSMEALRGGTKTEAANKEIEALGLEFRILTSFTSFVAVEEQIVNHNGTPTKVEVPVAIPEGVNRIMIDGVTETQDASLGNNFTSAQISNLPLNSRNAQALLTLQPGFAAPSAKTEKRKRQWGDPNSGFGNRSNGTGSGGGMGTGVGSGAGSGRGTGQGSGTGSASGNGTGTLNGSTSTQSVVNVSATVEVTADSSGYGSGGAPPPKALGVTSPLKILSKPQAKYNEAARSSGVEGSVRLKVTLLASGQVGSIVPVTRLPHGLTDQAIAAARLIKFEPAKQNGIPISKTVTIDYPFNIYDKTIEPGETVPPTKRPSAAEERLRILKEKLHTWLFSVVERLRTGELNAGPNESLFTGNGKAAVHIVLKTRSAETLEKLKALGFEPRPGKDGVNIEGLLPVNKIVDAAALEQVKLILPKT